MSKRIISINYDIPGHSDDYFNYWQDQSLLDADIVVFKPEDFHPSYGVKESEQIQELTNHWRKEISTAVEYGKTVFVILGKRKVAQVYTGNSEIKGTRKINYVTNYDNYNFFPYSLPEIISKSGTGITFKGNAAFASFWKEFGSSLIYEAYLNDEIHNPVFVTKTGERPVGGVMKIGAGHLVLLPVISYSEEEFTKQNKKDEQIWTEEAVRFGTKLANALLGIDKALRAEREKTPPPNWLSKKIFETKKEKAIGQKIIEIEKRIEVLEEDKKKVQSELDTEVQLKDLLFETGKSLELAVNMALETLGYKSENFRDGQLEIDNLVLSPEGERFIGECEGKDNSAINIDKFRQLAENIQSDLQREEVKEPATGILFGNGYRLKDPTQRDEFFTEKCLVSAKRGTILVRTTDLYFATRRAKEANDIEYARECREAISNGRGGIVQFPSWD